MKKILLLAFTASVMLGACKKDKDDDEPETLPTCAIVKTIEMGNSYTSVVKFDEQGRVKEQNSSNYSSLFEYHSDKIIFTENYPGHQNEITTHSLDGHGRIIKSVDEYRTTTYEYNNDGYLIKEMNSSNDGSTYAHTYIWESGNLVKISRTYSYGGSTTESSTITYGNDVLKDKLVAGSVYGELYSNWELHQYFGKQPINAPIRENDNGYFNNYTYIKDAKGNITAFKMTKDGETSPWWEYSVDYNCK